MTHRRDWQPRYIELLLAVTLAVACGEREVAAPSDEPGYIRVVIATEGRDVPASYELDLEEIGTVVVVSNDTVWSDALTPARYLITVRGIPEHCDVSAGENPRAVEVASSDTVSAYFGIACQADMRQRLLFQAHEETAGFQVYSIRKDGTGRFRLTSHPGGALAPVLTPDREALAYTWDGLGFLLDLETGTTIPLVEGVPQDFSADGSQLLYEAERDIWALKPADGTKQRITDTWPEWEDNLSWSPNGEEIAYSSIFDRVCVVAAADGSTRCITEGLLPFAQWPDWSSDGSRIAFSGALADDTGWRIYTIRPDGTELTRITDNPEYQDLYVSWSADGSELAFTRCTLPGGFCDIYLTDADGSNLRNVTQTPAQDEWNPEW